MGRPGNPHIQMNTISSFCICSFNLRGFSKNDSKLQMEKLLTATKFHDIIGMLDTHLNDEAVDVMGKINKLIFQEFHKQCCKVIETVSHIFECEKT